MYLIKTNQKDPKCILYNKAFEQLTKEIGLYAKVTEPAPDDPDGYFEVIKNQKSIGVAFVIDKLKPLVFSIEFEKEYGKTTATSKVDKELLTIISTAIKKTFSQFEVIKLPEN